MSAHNMMFPVEVRKIIITITFCNTFENICCGYSLEVPH